MARYYNNFQTSKKYTTMRKIYERILAARCVLFSKRVIVIDAALDKKRQQMAVGYWTTITDKDDQIVYMDQMTRTLKYERQEELQKDLNFNPQSN
jgi:hypothetical protein